jgi:hypothetical protein
LPWASLALRRAEKPARSACASAWSKVCGKVPHHVAAAQLAAIEAEAQGRSVDQPFQDIHCLGEARPARHADRRGVAQHRHDMQRNRRDAVHGALQMDVLVGLHATACARPVSAEIGHARDLEGEEAAVAVERQGGLGRHVARGMV